MVANGQMLPERRDNKHNQIIYNTYMYYTFQLRVCETTVTLLWLMKGATNLVLYSPIRHQGIFFAPEHNTDVGCMVYRGIEVGIITCIASTYIGCIVAMHDMQLYARTYIVYLVIYLDIHMYMYEQNKCGTEDKPISAGRCMVAEAIGTKALKIQSVRC